mmetsp:Transcript_11087/g.19543  ORF Transcript_11087/g.19543 Transcript_11087/m.19543 type:complete len:90 (+) Transcript_11087:44-313(+)
MGDLVRKQAGCLTEYEMEKKGVQCLDHELRKICEGYPLLSGDDHLETVPCQVFLPFASSSRVSSRALNRNSDLNSAGYAPSEAKQQDYL